MSEIKRCALLDTDFISKLYITKANDSDRLIYRVLRIADFYFVCHQQTSIELARHNQWRQNRFCRSQAFSSLLPFPVLFANLHLAIP